MNPRDPRRRLRNTHIPERFRACAVTTGGAGCEEPLSASGYRSVVKGSASWRAWSQYSGRVQRTPTPSLRRMVERRVVVGMCFSPARGIRTRTTRAVSWLRPDGMGESVR